MNPGDDDKFAADIISNAIEIMKPVMESAVVLGGHYAKGCGRDCVTAMDVSYSMKYCAMNLVGKQIGSLFPEVYDSDESEWETDSDQGREVDDDDDVKEEEFTRYEGPDELLNNINKAYDTWSSWEPYSPAERMLKNAIEKSDSQR
jgi:hypothetical protein